MKLEDNLDKAELDEIFKHTFDAYNGLLRHIGTTSLNQSAMKQAMSSIPASTATQVQESNT